MYPGTRAFPHPSPGVPISHPDMTPKRNDKLNIDCHSLSSARLGRQPSKRCDHRPVTPPRRQFPRDMHRSSGFGKSSYLAHPSALSSRSFPAVNIPTISVICAIGTMVIISPCRVTIQRLPMKHIITNSWSTWDGESCSVDGKISVSSHCYYTVEPHETSQQACFLPPNAMQCRVENIPNPIDIPSTYCVDTILSAPSGVILSAWERNTTPPTSPRPR